MGDNHDACTFLRKNLVPRTSAWASKPPYTLFVKTPRRSHVTEIKCVPQITHMAIDKQLELQNCTWSVSMRFQYGVKPPCAAIRISMRRGMESKRPWMFF